MIKVFYSLISRKAYKIWAMVCLCVLQKTLPVMVAVVEQLGGALGEPGLLVLPCVAAHINQVLSSFWPYSFFWFSLLMWHWIAGTDNNGLLPCKLLASKGSIFWTFQRAVIAETMFYRQNICTSYGHHSDNLDGFFKFLIVLVPSSTKLSFSFCGFSIL